MKIWDNKHKLLALGGVMLIALPAVAFAQDLNALKLTVIPSGDLIPLLSRLLQRVLLVIGIIAFFYLLYAGFMYVTAGGDAAKTKASMSTIVNVVIGIVIIAVSYILLTFVIAQTNSVGGRGGTASPTPRASATATARPRASTAPSPRTTASPTSSTGSNDSGDTGSGDTDGGIDPRDII